MARSTGIKLKKKKISIVTGVFNEEIIVKDVYEEIKKTLSPYKSKYNYEHIFMDNCSTDGTLTILKAIAKKDKNIKVLSYSKNFGPEKSGFMGLKYATGDALIPYEGSMKDPASMIPKFINYWENGYDLVYGIRKATADNILMRYMRRLFYRLVNFLSAEDIPENVGSYSLMDKKIVDIVKSVDDYKPYIRGIVLSLGFKQKGIVYTRGQRKKGKSKSSIGYLIDFTINAIISNSISPIRFCTYIGISLSVISITIAVVYMLLHIFFWKAVIPGVAVGIFLILIFSGIQLFFLGVIGEYIGAIHSQVRRKPFVVIKEKINF